MEYRTVVSDSLSETHVFTLNITKFLLGVQSSSSLLNSKIGIVKRLRVERPNNYASFPVSGKMFLRRDQTDPEAHSVS